MFQRMKFVMESVIANMPEILAGALKFNSRGISSKKGVESAPVRRRVPVSLLLLFKGISN